MQFGVNHLGHFALTGLLLDRLLNTTGARVVTVSSLAHWISRLTHTDTPWHPDKYNRYRAYFDSKLANLLFARQLGRLADQHGKGLISVAAHPGYSATNLQRNYAIARFANTFLAQSMAMGALPTLRAATEPDAASGEYFGPDRFMGFRGLPVKAGSSKRSKDTILADILWENSEQLTGVTYSF
jgi:NAD(P)-dependent dehydrogenase (short-subunit alcohol dehydrogenase family)